MSMLRRSFVLLSLMGLTLAFTVDASACNLLKRLCRGRGICRPVGPGIPGGGLVRESLPTRVMLPPEGGFPAAVNERVRVLLVLDDNCPDIGQTMWAIGDQLKFLFANALPEKVIERNSPSNGLVILRSSRGELTSARVRSAIDRLQVSPTDALVCWWGTHGAAASGGTDQELFLPNDQSRFSRSELFELMRAKSPRLNMLMLESCNGFPAVEAIYDMAEFEGVPVSPVFAELLLRHQGEVGITAASPGELAWTNTIRSTYFFDSFFGLVFGEDRVTWQDAYATIREGTATEFRSGKAGFLASFDDEIAQADALQQEKLRRIKAQIEPQEDQRPFLFVDALATPDLTIESSE